MTEPPKSPGIGRSVAARRLWEQVTASFELEEFEMVVLRQAVAAVDTVEDLRVIVEREGTMTQSPQGPKVHPAVIEIRNQSQMVAKMLSTLRLPTAEEDVPESARPQRRSGVRSVPS